MNFQNTKEVIVKHGPKNINLFHFSHRCHGLGDSKESLSLIFSVFMISWLRHVFATRIPASWRWISRNRERFFFKTSLSTKTVLIFYTAVVVWELQVAFWSLVFIILPPRKQEISENMSFSVCNCLYFGKGVRVRIGELEDLYGYIFILQEGKEVGFMNQERLERVGVGSFSVCVHL